jgi:hypothetical protein
MVNSGVKRKLPIVVLTFAAGLTAFSSWAGLFSASLVENVYAHHTYPTISHIAKYFADAVGFSWLDVWLLLVLAVVIFSLFRRNWQLPLALIGAGYLIFFWGWGLNYHRKPMQIRLGIEGAPPPTGKEVDRLTEDTALELNRLWPVVAEIDPVDRDTLGQLAAERVRRVVAHIDGQDWSSASRIKHSYLANWWFRIAGIEGIFNPYGHEPILVSGLPEFEHPFLMAHELAHVHGIADEGEANFVAYMACLESDRPEFQYSAAFEMWLHLAGATRLLDPGPRRDLQTYIARLRSDEIPQVTRLQSAILDKHLKAQGVPNGIQSYSKVVTLAIATRDRWAEFR